MSHFSKVHFSFELLLEVDAGQLSSALHISLLSMIQAEEGHAILMAWGEKTGLKFTVVLDVSA